ncbi:MAG: putative molybdenum carrier protein [Ignavibacteria bacterium]
MRSSISRIISGGQTGSDRAALEAARLLNINTGGYCPKGYKTEDGYDKSLKQFGLKQTQTDNPTERTILNIKVSDGTVIFGKIYRRRKVISPGTLLTLNSVKEYHKPFLVNPTRKQFQDWLFKNRIKILNVAGNRLSENQKIYDSVFNFMMKSFIDTALIEFRKKMLIIRENNILGSKDMLNNIISASIKYLRNTHIEQQNAISVILKETESFTQGKNSEMMILYRFIKELKHEIKSNPKKDILNYLIARRKSLKDSSKKLTLSTMKEIQFENKTVLLISNSSSITSLFKELSKMEIRVNVLQCKSYPGCEGIVQAEVLKSYGFKVKLIHERDIKYYVQKADMALLGCDAYNKTYFSNKTGSLEIAKTFFKFNKPVYVLSEKAKYSSGFYKKHNLSGMFDTVPQAYVTKLIKS